MEGEFQCIGSVQHLKHKFGTGIEVQAKAKSRDQVGAMKEHLLSTFREATVLDEHLTLVVFNIPRG